MSKTSKSNAQERAAKVLAAAENHHQEKNSNPKLDEQDFVVIPAPHVGKDQDQAFPRKLPVVEVLPQRCRPWAHHNRNEAWLNKDSCSDLIKSIASDGQQEPALLRELANDPDFDYEIIYGVRRWFACKNIPNQRLLAYVTEKSDRECMILMHVENANSKDITEMERAYSFKRHLESGEFKNQKELSQAMNLDTSVISRYMQAASIFEYDWLVKVLPPITTISIRKATELAALLKDRYSRDIIISRVNDVSDKGDFKGNIISHLIKSCDNDEQNILDNVMSTLKDLRGVGCKIDSKGRLVLHISSGLQKEETNKIKAVIDTFVEA